MTSAPGIVIRPLLAGDLPAADRVMRVAFGTHLGLPEPAAFMGDAAYVPGRWRADPSAAFCAEAAGEVVGSSFAANWGSVGILGPLTVRPDFQGRGVGKRLVEPVMACFERWGVSHAGLYTFAESAKHVGLYRGFGFWPRFLTSIVSKSTRPGAPAPYPSTYSGVPERERAAVLDACRDLTDAIHAGLDLGAEIVAVAAHDLGDTVLVWDDARLDGFAVCHHGPGSEGGSGACHVKFGAARAGPGAGRDFERLLDACAAFAVARGAPRLSAGVNAARQEACRAMLARGFRTDRQGVAMHRPNEPGYSHPGIFVLDDWR